MRYMPHTTVLTLALAVVWTAACSGSAGRPSDSLARLAAPAATRPLALVRDRRLLVRDGSGAERELMQTPDSAFAAFPAWSPDGAQIVYVLTTPFPGRPDTDWGSDVYLIAPGGSPRLVWEHDQPGAVVQGLAWMPGGSTLLIGYELTRYTADLTYQGRTQRIERLALADGTRTPLIDGALYPSVARDGSLLAYQTRDASGQGGIWIAAADGGGARMLVETGPRFLAMFPRIAPDGRAIVFAGASARAAEPATPAGGMRTLRGLFRPRAAAAHGPVLDLWRVTVADGTIHRLAALAEDEPYPAWSRDGSSVAVLATGGLYQIEIDGSAPRKIAPGAFGGHVDSR